VLVTKNKVKTKTNYYLKRSK